ncbi:hypothetical protein [Amycolatopsis sp. NPDC098790]|uniref:hypothetical protein n=1 Tax=Amycolatopsis sp. NPDC098790 TaxID=3363939 RepID=UPI00380FC65B
MNRGDESDRLLVAWETNEDRAGEPVVSNAPVVTVPVPHDIEELRRQDPDSARAWRREVRLALQSELTAGAEIIGFGDSGYLVRRGDSR